MDRVRFSHVKQTGFVIAVSVWLAFGLTAIFRDSVGLAKGRIQLSRLTMDERRAIVTGRDFYRFLKLCDAIIPQEKDVKWVFRRGNYLGYDEYLFYRAYYFLYPRNYRENADYIILFGRKDYDVPAGFTSVAEFGKNNFILTRQAR